MPDWSIGSRFLPILSNESRYLFMYGGGGSGKSETAGYKMFLRGFSEGDHTFLILRKVRRRCRDSVVPVMRNILDHHGVRHSFNKTDLMLHFRSKNFKPNTIIFDGMDDPDKIKSIKAITSVWLEELTEFTRKDFMQINLRLREKTPFYKQIIGTYNPDESAGAWIKEDFHHDEKPYTGKGKFRDSYLMHSTLRDNPIQAIRDEYKLVLGDLQDTVYTQIYRDGLWAVPKGLIYPEWDIVEPFDFDYGWFDDIFYGGDFGYSINPTAVVKVYRKADEYWLEELLYESGLTNPEIANKLKADNRYDPTKIAYWDSAEPKSVDELNDYGILALPAVKGADSVRSGIQFLQSRKIHVIRGSDNIIDERKKYKWREDKDGNLLNEPVKYKDHILDAARYSIHTDSRGGANFPVAISQEDFY